MQSKKYKIVKTTSPKKIAIVGAGIGGMEAARVLALRGHKPVIFEKGDRLGGVFNYAAAPDFKSHDKKLIAWYELEMKKLDIEINFNSEVDSFTDFSDFDSVIVATGSEAIKPNIPGLDTAIEACDYLGGAEVGQKVMVIGGGLTGCEIAYDLHQKGKTPIIVEMKNDLIAAKGVCLSNSSYLRDYFALHNVEVHLETKLKAIENGVAKLEDKDKNELSIDADSYISSMGYKAAPLGLTNVKKQYYVGDCNGVGNLRTVIWRAWDVAMKL